MKSIDEYIFEKTGLTVEEQSFANSMNKYFSFNDFVKTENGIKFNDVKLKKSISFNSDTLKKGTILESLEIRKNGWLNICEDDNNSYTIMKNNLSEQFMIPFQTDNYEKFPNVTAIQLGAMTDIQRVIEAVKKLSLEDANYLKSIMGPSLEEKILRTIVDAVLYDTPPSNGMQNGI